MPKPVPLVCVVDCRYMLCAGRRRHYAHTHYYVSTCIVFTYTYMWKLHSRVCFCAYVGLCFLFSIFLFSIPLSYIEVAACNLMTNSVPPHIISFDPTKSSGII